MSWEIARLRQPWLARGRVAGLLDCALSYPNIIWLLILRVSVAALMILGPGGLITRPWIILIAAVLCWLFVMRTSYGQDGADQMAYILYTGLAISSLAGTVFVRVAFLWFIALQSCLAYCVAGIAKASAKGWRDGDYLTAVSYTHIYGHPRLAGYLISRPDLAKTLARTLILWESTFPLVLVMPEPVAGAMLATGILFHLTNGYLMGLNTFIWSFVATYPAICYCVQTRGW